MVRKLLCAVVPALVAAVLLAPTAAKADYFTGHWHFVGGMGHVEAMNAICVIAVNSHGAVAGQCTGPFGVAQAEGVTNGLNIVLRVHHVATRPGGITGIATFKGIWYRSGVIRGTYIDSPFPGGVGSFTAYPVH
ncbi:MAG TPA: hypothetical protein VEJ20_08305 [Candidatus Eremiobacteraceae bacterium]|nr:hypothetical protein [Candidatus Eremiobacteraceae bacterium]